MYFHQINLESLNPEFKRISFAGKEFIINSKGEVIETEQIERIQEELKPKRKEYSV